MIQEKTIVPGLTTREAEKRMKNFGLNEIQHKKKASPIMIFLSQFNDFMVWVLLGATIISGIMGDTADAITIIIIVIVNAILGFVQEFRTEKSLEALKNLAAPTCKVFRDGGLKVINSAYLTIGDVVVLEAGDRIPADGEFLEGSSIMVDESLLTGESVGVSKDTNKKEKRSGYMGTTMLKGKGLFTVTSIGMDTEMGKIANLLDNIKEEKSPLKERLESLGKILVVLCLVICAVVTILGIIRGNDITEMFLLGVSLAVAAIPEGLAAIVTVSLALGVSRMLKRNALVRKLPAVETLGCTSVICSDKTGTLTQNKMTVKEVYLNGKICELDKEKLTDYTMLMKSLVLCNDCNYDFNVKNIDKALHGDPTETALVKLFFKDTNLLKAFVEKSERVYDIPFDSTRKMMSVIMRENGKECCYVKGAPERVIEKCSYILENNKIKPLTYQKKKQVASFIEAMSSRALRCIAGAYKDENLTRSEKLEDGLIFIGVAGSIDPPRAEARDAVLRCKLAGIKPVMITGDHKNTALAIAKSLNICNNDDQVVTGEDIESMTDDELKKKVEKIRVFARVSPDHKLRIVRAFKRNNNVVAMTGDGVNDAPALKQADIGIAMGITGTEVSKDAASMILTDDNFATIVKAITNGRNVYENIKNSIRFLLSGNTSGILAVLYASIAALPVPFMPVHLLFINLLTDSLPAIAIGMEKPRKDLLKEKPRDSKESILTKDFITAIGVEGLIIAIFTLIAFHIGLASGNNAVASTMAFSTLCLGRLFHGFNCRSKASIFKLGLTSNKYSVYAFLGGTILLNLVLFVKPLQKLFEVAPLTLTQVGLIYLLAFLPTVIIQGYKVFRQAFSKDDSTEDSKATI